MSLVADIYDKLHVIMSTELSTYTRIPNAYEPNENPELFLRKGYGIGYGAGTNTNRQICDKFSIRRTYTIVLINQVYSTMTNSSSRGTFESSLMNDQKTLINAIENDITLTGSCINARFVGDSGIEYVDGDSNKYILIESSFDIEYLETIS